MLRWDSRILAGGPASGSFFRRVPVAPVRKVVCVRLAGRRLLFQPLLGLLDQNLFVVQTELAQENAAAKKNEVGVEDVAPAVIVDGAHFTGVEHVLDFGTVDACFSRFADEIRQQIEAAGDADRAEVGEQVE